MNQYWFDLFLACSVGILLGMIIESQRDKLYPSDLPVAEPVQYDTDIKRMVFGECLKRIQSIKEMDQWYESARECGEIARWESSI